MIVKYVQGMRNGVQSYNLSRHGIGYVLKGKKYIHYGDVRYEINRGEVFCLGVGTHYMEDVPEQDKPFEQIMFYYTPDQLSRILHNLSVEYGLNITNDHSCPNCSGIGHVSYSAWSSMKSFFSTVDHYLKDDVFGCDDTAENIKITELIYLILSHKECCLKSKVLGNMDRVKENFEQMVRSHIFKDISVEELAHKCNRSLTSFKKEFSRNFYDSPHKWFTRQRLMHSRLLLISTTKSISEIGNECLFPNTSHFIKLFKKEYGMTPASYRNNHETDDRMAASSVAVGENTAGK